MDHVVVDAVLGIGGGRVGAVQPFEVGLVLAEQQLRVGAIRAGRGDQFHRRPRSGGRWRPTGRRRPAGRPGLIVPPRPGVAEPGGGQHVDGVGLRAGVGELDDHQQVVRAGLGVVHLGDPVPVAVERAGVQQLVLGLVAVPPGVDVDQVLVGERRLRIVVAPPVPGVAGDGVQVPPVLLDVLAVVALRAGEPERALLQDRVPPVPQRQGQAQPLLDVAEPGQAVLPPPVGPGPRVIVRQVVPRVAVGAVVLPDRAPLPLADVRPPPVPVPGLQQPVLQPAEPGDPLTFRTHHHSLTLRVPLPDLASSISNRDVRRFPPRLDMPDRSQLRPSSERPVGHSLERPPADRKPRAITAPESPEPLLRPRSISLPPAACPRRDETAPWHLCDLRSWPPFPLSWCFIPLVGCSGRRRGVTSMCGGKGRSLKSGGSTN